MRRSAQTPAAFAHKPLLANSSIKQIIALSLLAGAVALAVHPGSVQAQTASRSVEASQRSDAELVVVTGTRTPHLLADAPVETQVVTREDILRSGSLNMAQLLRGVHGFTSTSQDDTLNSDNVRSSFRGFGVNSNAGLVLVDGRRSWGRGMGSHNAMNPTMNQVPVSMIERIEVVKGAASSLYGADAMAGVINIITRPVPAEPYFTVAGGYGQYSVQASEGSTNPVVDSTRDSRNFNAAYGAPVGESSGFNLSLDHRADEGPGRLAEQATADSLRGRFTSELAPQWRLDLDASVDRQRVEPARGQTNQRSYIREYDTVSAGAALAWRTDSQRVDTTLSYSEQDVLSANSAAQYMAGDYQHTMLESVYTYFGAAHTLTLGAELRRDEADLVSVRNSEREYGVVASINNSALFAQDEILLLDDRLTVIPGVRAERHSYYGSSLSPNLATMYQLADRTRLRASVGRAFKSPTIQQLYMDQDRQHSNIEFLRANPDLDPETAISISAGIEHSWDALPLWTSLSVFQNRPRDLVVTVDLGEEINGLPLRTFDNLDRARIEGVEMAFQLGDRQGLYLNGNAGWTQTEDRGQGPHAGNELRYVPDYQINLTPGYILPTGRHGIQASMIRVGPQWQNDTNTQRIAAHNVLDASLWMALGEGFNAPRLSLDATNLTNSDKGERQINRYRQGRSLRLSLRAEF